MKQRIVCAPGRPVACALAITLASTVLIASGMAQTPPPPTKNQAPPNKGKTQTQTQTQPNQKGNTAPPPQQQGGSDLPQLIYSPWTKFCLKGEEANAKQVCFTGKDGRFEDGLFAVAAVLIEPEGEPRKILRVTLPIGVSLQPGTRVIVDQGQPMTGPFVVCFPNGCMADIEASAELVQKLKRGQGLVVQGFSGPGTPMQLGLPLVDFAKAYDGPPTDPKEMEERQKKLQDELQRRAEEARKRLDSGQQSTAPKK